MSCFTSLCDALAQPDAAFDLDLDLSQGAIPPAIGELTRLESLRLRNCPGPLALPEEMTRLTGLRHLAISAAQGTWTELPTFLQRLPIESLEVDETDLSGILGLRHLKRLNFVARNLARDVRRLAEGLPGLVDIQVRPLHMVGDILPPAISRFRCLETLVLTSCGLTDLPPELAELGRMRVLRLHNLLMETLPEVVTRLEGLEELGITQEACRECRRNPRGLTGLPWDLAKLTKLRRLDLSYALNNGSDEAGRERDEDEDALEFAPVPSVLGELADLEHLNLDGCGVMSIEALAPLRSLKSLSLRSCGLATCEPFSQHPLLEDLDLRNSHQLQDFTPLVHLTRLRKLGLRECLIIDLGPLAGLPALAELDIEETYYQEEHLPLLLRLPALVTLHARAEVLATWKRRRSIAARPESFRPRLASADRAEAVAALRELAAWLGPVVDGIRELWTIFGLDSRDDLSDSQSMVELPELDRFLELHLSALTSEELGTAIACVLREVYANPRAVVTIVQEMVRRADVVAQKMAVRAFFDSCTDSYEPDHRWHDERVLDQLIDDLFPQFESEPLADLLSEADSGMLDREQGDAVDALFAPAFARCRDEATRTRLVNRLRSYLQKMWEEIPDFGEELLSELDPEIRTRCCESQPVPPLPDGVDVTPPERSPSEAVRSLLDIAHDQRPLSEIPDLLRIAGTVKLDAMAGDELAEHVVRLSGKGAIEEVCAFGLLLPYLELDSRSFQRILAQATACAILTMNREIEDLCLGLAPAPNAVHWKTLAFNLACLAALRGDKSRMLAYAQRAVEVGQPQRVFLNDTDFTAYYGDPAFLEATCDV